MPASFQVPSDSEGTMADTTPGFLMGVREQSHHNKTIVEGNGKLSQHYGAVHKQTTTNYILSPLAQKKLPPLPRCPAPSPNHTPRKSIEDRMFSYFFKDTQGMKCFVLSGPGGVGKTEVALHFVDTYFYRLEQDAKRFERVFWVDATTAETIDESFEAIALSTGEGSKAEDAIRWLADRESRDRRWIIIFNNADDPNLNLTNYFPNCSHGNILITTRNYYARRYGAGSGSHYAVSEMTPDEALTTFMEYARLSDDPTPSLIEAAKVLVNELGYFALSVSQAGAFISASPYTPSEYLDLHCKRRQELFQEHERMKLTDYQHQTIYATWMVSYDRLDEPTKRFVRVCAHLYYGGITEIIFSKACSGGADQVESKRGPLFTESERAGFAELRRLCQSLSTNGKWDVMKFRRLIKALQSYSLVTFDAEQVMCSMHPLVHEWAGNLGDVEEQMVLRECAALLLGCSLVAFNLAEDLAYCRALAPHVDRVFQGTNPKSSAWGGRFGRVYYEAGRWNDAVTQEEPYKELLKEELGKDSVSIHPSAVTLTLPTIFELPPLPSCALGISQIRRRSSFGLPPPSPHEQNDDESPRRTITDEAHQTVMEARRIAVFPEVPNTLSSNFLQCLEWEQEDCGDYLEEEIKENKRKRSPSVGEVAKRRKRGLEEEREVTEGRKEETSKGQHNSDGSE